MSELDTGVSPISDADLQAARDSGTTLPRPGEEGAWVPDIDSDSRGGTHTQPRAGKWNPERHDEVNEPEYYTPGEVAAWEAFTRELKD